MDRKKPYEIVSLEDQIRQITSWIVDIILVIVLAFFLTWAFGTRVTMQGSSMTPLISSGERLMINRLEGRLVPLKRFDIAAYTLPEDSSVYLKMILGLPGETVQIRDGQVYINNELLQDERLCFSIPNAGSAEKPILLGGNEYFVIGRSPEASRDSRYPEIGNIRLEQIQGTVWLRYAPFSAFGFIREPEPETTEAAQ